MELNAVQLKYSGTKLFVDQMGKTGKTKMLWTPNVVELKFDLVPQLSILQPHSFGNGF